MDHDAAQGAAAAGGALAGGSTSNTYNQWTGLFAYFFLLLTYTFMYIAIVQKSFELIHILPDKVLRWLSGGMQESLGSESAGMAKQLEQKVEAAGQKTGAAIDAAGASMLKKAGKKGGSSSVSGSGGGSGGGS